MSLWFLEKVILWVVRKARKVARKEAQLSTKLQLKAATAAEKAQRAMDIAKQIDDII